MSPIKIEKKFINDLWDQSIIPTLIDYVKIPNKSPQFDPHWEEHGYMHEAVQLIMQWCEQHAYPGMTLEMIQLPHRTPLIYIEIPGDAKETILLYGHLDKQPEMTGWHSDLGPWQPVLRDDRLYGRGAADDGYAAFASLTALLALHRQNLPHSRCIILIEACEESGSYDLPFYIEALSEKIGTPSLIICLDSGCGNYEQLWLTTSLRGLLGGVLAIDVLTEGIHSGAGSGVVPSPCRLLRQLINRIEEEANGNMVLKDLSVEIPQRRKDQAKQAASVLESSLVAGFPFIPHVQPEAESIEELILRRTWKPALSIIGLEGLPILEHAGNVTIPSLSVKLSIRLPPTCDAEQAGRALKKALERDPPYQAKVSFTLQEASKGWNAPAEADWLNQSVQGASLEHFGQSSMCMGEGGSIPFMGMLGEKFPQAQFVITGVLGPESNAHGPNEFLHIPTGKKLTACVAQIIADHYQRNLKPLQQA
ncbi:MAG: M20/M25/M40 family metallo-hydrolase [Gammaproteobacteria bacterium]|nr:M20/M25/M40 family metallo-hydrolase [Gammaproteobacteria bacterium]